MNRQKLTVDIDDASLDLLTGNERPFWSIAHWAWARIFGRRVPTSGDRAHIDGMLLAYRPELTGDEWKHTDARRVHRIGNLMIYDYRGDTTIETYTEELNRSRPEQGNRNGILLADNKRKYPLHERT